MYRMLSRISHEILERNRGSHQLVLIGICTRGVPLARRISERIKAFEGIDVPVGALDIGPHRDDLFSADLRRTTSQTNIPINITGKCVVLVDDVVYTGRTVRAAMDALIDRGRPQAIHLAVLIDRGHREFPIKPDYVGKNMPSSRHEDIKVRLSEIDGRDEVTIVDKTFRQPTPLGEKG